MAANPRFLPRKVPPKFLTQLLDKLTNQSLRSSHCRAACVTLILLLTPRLGKDLARWMGQNVYRTRREAQWNRDFVPPDIGYCDITETDQEVLAPLRILTRKIRAAEG